MSESRKLRDQVADAYGKAVTKDKTGGCCGAETAPKGTVAMLAGYGLEDLKGLPPDAVVNSFGCGNPVAFSDVREGDTVLDLGSGAGIDILIAARKVGPAGRAIGIDMTDEMIERAKENIAAAGLDNVEVRKGIIEELPVESDSVDWVISNCVINLSPEKEKVFAEIARVLKPGGRMLISDLVLTDAPDWIRTIPSLYNSCIAGAISEEAYLSGLREAGLEEVEVRDRITYETPSIREFFGSDETEGCCGGESMTEERIEKLAGSLKGKAASIQVFARKPA